MEKIKQIASKYTHIMFLDFEGTQYSHEMIAFGAILCKIDGKGFITRKKDPIKFYVKAKNKIGHYVSELTGITQEMLDNEGIDFSKALEEIKKYAGVAFTKCLFSSFGNHDITILNSSISYNFDYSKEITFRIHNNYMDCQALISAFIKDKNHNPLSLSKYLELFQLTPIGVSHDPKSDAENLALIYDAFLKRKDIVLEEYMKLLTFNNTWPTPVKNVIRRLVNGETITPDDFYDELKEFVK